MLTGAEYHLMLRDNNFKLSLVLEDALLSCLTCLESSPLEGHVVRAKLQMGSLVSPAI